MTGTSFVFALEIFPFDSEVEAERGKKVILWTPCLKLYSSRKVAASREEGLKFIERDIWFFAADGSALEPKFSNEPYVNDKTYFAGVYSLTAGMGETLQRVLVDRLNAADAPHMRFVVWMPATEELAKKWGWPDIQTMTEAAERALQIFPADLRSRVVSKSRG